MKQRIALLGSTGSIGIQTLDIVRENPGLFEITTLTAHRNWERLARQAVEFDADSVVIADERRYDALRQALDDTSIKVYAGEEALRQVVQSGQVDVVVNALVGYAGLMPTIAAVEAGKKVALANKETLVAGGCYVMPLAARHKAPIVPIDSEHSAIFQCLTGEKSPVRRLIVTCSGGAFRDRSREELAHVTVEQALKHPQWRMGDKITIDSATLVNKGFEVIEAHWLFGVPAERISVLIHPQSIVHSMVEFGDGAIKASWDRPTCGHRSPMRSVFRSASTVRWRLSALQSTPPSPSPSRSDQIPGTRPRLRLSAARRHGRLHDERRQRSGRGSLPRPPMRLSGDRAQHRIRTGQILVRSRAVPRGPGRSERRSPVSGRRIPAALIIGKKHSYNKCFRQVKTERVSRRT